MQLTRSALAAAALALGAVFANGHPAGAAGITLGQPAPTFRLTTLDGKTVTLADYRGRTLVLNVWGSWCPPCRIETPGLIAEARAQGSSVAFLGIDTTETPAVVRAFTVAKGVRYPQIVTTSASDFARDYDIRNYPTTIVIDPSGIVRARHADNLLPRPQLQAYIAAAKLGRSAPLVSDEQRKLDGMLAPAQFALTGAPPTVSASAAAAARAIGSADDEMDETMTDATRDHDLVKTRAEESTLRDAAIAALAPIAASDADRVLLADLRGDHFNALGDWAAADAAYAQAVAIDVNDTKALGGQAYAASQRGDDARAAALDLQIAHIRPSYASWIALARIDAKRGEKTAAFRALDRATALAQQTQRPAFLAWTHLYGGRAAVAVGDAARAKAEFTAAQAAAALISARDPRHVMYLEESQEALVALSLGRGAKAAVSLTPWTGPELPGSIKSTLKYRLVATGTPGTVLDLNARGVPKGWIASFCTDRVCAPFHVSFVVPTSSVKIIEFQIIPDGPKVRHDPRVRVDASQNGRRLASVTQVVPASPESLDSTLEVKP